MAESSSGKGLIWAAGIILVLGFLSGGIAWSLYVPLGIFLTIMAFRSDKKVTKQEDGTFQEFETRSSVSWGDVDDTMYEEPATDSAASGEFADDTPDASWDCKVIQAFQMLGLSADATFDEVKIAFRKLCRDFHPDVVRSKGLNPEFTGFSERRFREIRTAYEVLCEAFGEG